MPDNNSDTTTTKPTSSSILSSIQGLFPLIVALAVLIIFWLQGRGLLALAQNKDIPELVWSRSAYVYEGVQAIAFAAAGFLFGREVNRKRAENAEERADDAQQQAGEAKKKATEAETKGKAIAALAEQKAATHAQKANQSKSFSPPNAGAATESATGTDLSEVAALAKKLFP